MASAAAPLLYVHPCGHLNDLVVPAGALGCMNAVTVPKLGRYGFEVSDEELRGALVLATDLHWAIGLAGLERLLRHARRLNPALRTIVGGISAGHYASALLEGPAVDFVIRGDSEVAFASLVGQLLAGNVGEPVPNVLAGGGASAPARRMTGAEFDATDVLEADWFPTYEKVSRWDAAAFGMGRTIAVARGCPMRCPACYGSYASTFGPGVLVRSAAGLAQQLRRAEAMQLQNLRLVLGKPPPATLTEWTQGLASAGPFRFETAVGIYLCRAPSREDLDALEAAFAGPVTLSLVPPVEHVPSLAPERLEEEMAAWRFVAERVSRSRDMSLDVWTVGSSDPTATRLAFGVGAAPEPVAGEGGTRPARERVTVSLGAVWNISRPIDGDGSPSLAEMRALSDRVWTFYAARLLSPALAELLAPFALLDELERSPDAAERPKDGRAPYFDLVMQSWREHWLPAIPGLVLYAVGLTFDPNTPRCRHAAQHGVRLAGALELITSADRWTQVGPAVRLWPEPDHTGVRLVTRGPIGETGDAVALVPAMLPEAAGDPCPPHWISELSRYGLVGLDTGGSTASGANRTHLAAVLQAAWSLQVTLRVQQAEVALLGRARELLRHGKADLRYLRPPPDRR